MNDLYQLSVAELASLIGRREVSPVEMIESFLDRIGMFDRQLHTLIVP